MKARTTHQNLGFVLVGIVLLGFAIAYLWQGWSVISVACDETGDYAANALQVERALDFQETSGPYSRYKFRHPGPTLFYLRALGETLLSPLGFSPFSAHLLTQFLLNLLFLGGILCIFARYFQSRLALLITFFVFTWPLSMGVSEAWGNTWGPFVVVIPVVASLVGAASFSAGSLGGLYLFFISSLVAVHTHVGTAQAIVPALLLVIFATIKRYRFYSPKEQRYVLSASALYLVFAFVPALLNLLTYGEQGGFYRLVSFFLRRAGEHSTSEAIHFLVERFVAPFGLELTSGQELSAVLILLLLTFIASDLSNFFARSARWLILLVFLLGVVSVRRIDGELMPYLGYFYSGISCLALALILAWFAQRIESYVLRKIAPLAWTVVLLCFTLVMSVLPVYLGVRAAANPLCNDRPTQWRALLAHQPNSVYVLTMGETGLRGSWDTALAFALQLKRDDISFCVPSRLRYLFGDQTSCASVFEKIPAGTHVRFLTLFRTKSLPKASPLRQFPSVKGITLVENAPIVWERWGRRWQARWGETLHFPAHPESRSELVE
ncbi:MAG: hypothetical protein KDD55_03895 [Bdellovibrionales bacterium]|nr:hypothetical protein [Bdellovibrionales bacterium]